MPRLENWSVCASSRHIYEAPELWQTVLRGEVYGSNKFEDKTIINTSQLKEINTITKKATTSNSVYELGEPSESFLSYLKDNEMTIDSYCYIDTKDIKITKKTTLEIKYSDFTRLVEKVYGQEYDFVEDMGCSNNSFKIFNGVGKDGILANERRRELDRFIKIGKYDYIARILLNDMCDKKIIESGNYLINVSW